MPNLHRDFLTGVTSSLLSSSGTSLASAELAGVPVVAGSDRILITLDPDGSQGAPEVVEITGHTSGATTATVVRGRLGTSPREHLAGTPWVHSLYASEFDNALADVASRVLKSGDTMTGQLTLAGAPTSSTHAASKTYVDTTAVAAQGGAWQSWTPVVTYVPLLGATTTLGITVLSARWQQLGKTVDAFATIRFNSSPTPPAFSANGEVRITIPAACRADAVSVGPLGTAGIADLQQGGGTSFTFGLVYPYSTTVAKVQLPGLYGAGGGVWGGDPAVGQISTNDNLGLSLRYEVP